MASFKTTYAVLSGSQFDVSFHAWLNFNTMMKQKYKFINVNKLRLSKQINGKIYEYLIWYFFSLSVLE